MPDDRLDEILRRLDGIEARMATKGDLAELSHRIGRQVTVTEALRSDIRMLTGITHSILTAVQTLIAGYTDLAGRVTDLENPQSNP